tara:strand:- start:178 stop:867 length:690 start_codon:yes stop_codon:yes gene_type:complete
MPYKSENKDDFPSLLPIFPLSGALLLPGGRLPLNIFEPRYLNLITDSLASGRFFGMIQPNLDASRKDNTNLSDLNEPQDLELYKIGCLGKVVYFEEADDGRFLIALRGITRFEVKKELESIRGYRVLDVSYNSYLNDKKPEVTFEYDRESLFDILPNYLDAQGLKLSLDAIEALSDLDLIITLSMICPFNGREKQALLECNNSTDRSEMLLALLQMGVFGNSDNDEIFQ